MSPFEVTMVIFSASTFLVALIGLIVYIVDIITKKR
ncbi:MAG: putative holin-like toxin [Defluviitaleaceae bacterium]|nr:putative holin-like toxin [Defluviitaleaceae bacterium]